MEPSETVVPRSRLGLSACLLLVPWYVVLHISVYPRVFGTLHGTLRLLEDSGPPPVLRYVIMWLPCVWPHRVRMKRPCVRVERRRQDRGGAIYLSATEEGLSRGMFLTASSPSPSTIPERISYEQASCTVLLYSKYNLVTWGNVDFRHRSF